MFKPLRLVGLGLLSLVIIAVTLWGVAAVSFRASSPLPLAGSLIVVAVAGLWGLWAATGALRWLAIAPGLAAALGVGLWWASLAPGAARDWAEPLARLPIAAREGDALIFQNVRDFRWKAAEDGVGLGSGEAVAEARWITRRVALDAVAGVDLFFSYWAGPNIAHMIVSFPLDGAPPLAFSIEIRRERGEAYSPIAGFFKSYELAILAAEEADIIKLRTDVWREDVRLYRLTVGRENARRLLLAYVREINALAERPRWYHTLWANCTTVAFRLARELWPNLSFDRRILLPGHAPDYAHEIGALAPGLPLDDIKRLAAVSERARGLPADARFGGMLREGVPVGAAP